MRALSAARPASLACAAAMAFALAGPAALAAQQGPCARDPGELARAVMSVRAPTGLSPAQQQLYGGVVAELRAGNTAAARSQFVALIRSNPALARGAGLCALLHAAVRQGTLEADPRALAGMRALAAAADRARARGEDSNLRSVELQHAYQDNQQAVSTVASIQKTMHDAAMAVLGNMKA